MLSTSSNRATLANWAAHAGGAELGTEGLGGGPGANAAVLSPRALSRRSISCYSAKGVVERDSERESGGSSGLENDRVVLSHTADVRGIIRGDQYWMELKID
ncbi:hypothetical protein B0H13DRAFT_1853654 [Mycena leptocephala]|nr:hypothetical protein B0H13DRAFT_1853654 [Mycena leptocephala]